MWDPYECVAHPPPAPRGVSASGRWRGGTGDLPRACPRRASAGPWRRSGTAW